MGLLEGRVAIVTGASVGIGRGCAVRYAEEGAAVVAAARSADKLESLVREIEAKGGRAVAVPCDVEREEDIDKVVETALGRFGKIDILANIAQGGNDDLTDIMGASRRNVLYAYATGPLQSLLFMQKCFPHMKARGYGRIINTSSNSLYNGTPGLTGYEMAKGAIQALTRNASQEWAPFGIVTNCFIPLIKTEQFINSRFAAFEDQLVARVPVRRMGDPYNDCAPVLVFLASEGAGYVNGQVVAIDGGFRLIA